MGERVNMNELIHPEIEYFVTKKCSPDWAINNNKHPSYGVVFITEGSTEYEVNGVRYYATAGDVIFITPGSVRNATTTGMSCIAIDFKLLKDEKLEFPTVFSWGSFEEFHLLFQDIKFEWLQKEEGYKLKSQALFMLILHKLIYERKKQVKNIHVENMKFYIMKNYMKNITVSHVADHVKLSSVYCGALFKKIEGRTLAEFMNQVRINRAIDLLETNEYTITEIAEETGFMDVYYFSNMFKKIVGTSPSTYKKKLL